MVHNHTLSQKLPIYGCLTGVVLNEDSIEIFDGLTLRSVYVDTFGTKMMAFSPPPGPNSHHPGPWVGVGGGNVSFEGRTEIVLSKTDSLNNLPIPTACWLVAAVLRLRVSTPIRLLVLSNVSFSQMKEKQNKEINASAFEGAPHQIGVFTEKLIQIGTEEISWLQDMLPIAANLYNDDQFRKAFTIYEQAQWAPSTEMGVSLIWTALEILFGLSNKAQKKKVISAALSNYVGEDEADKEKARHVILHLYTVRGRAVHAGKEVDIDDAVQSFQFAKIAFQRVLIDGKMPTAK